MRHQQLGEPGLGLDELDDLETRVLVAVPVLHNNTTLLQTTQYFNQSEISIILDQQSTNQSEISIILVQPIRSEYYTCISPVQVSC